MQLQTAPGGQLEKHGVADGFMEQLKDKVSQEQKVCRVMQAGNCSHSPEVFLP